MRAPARRCRIRVRPRVEALEGRALLSGAGTLDSTFGAGSGAAYYPVGVPYYAGVQAITYPAPADYQYGTSVTPEATVAESNGQVVTAAFLGTTGGAPYSLGLVRDNADGSLDTTFGSNGLVVIPIGGKVVHFQGEANTAGPPADVSMAVQADGKILVATEAADAAGGPNLVVVRLNVNGSVDTTYGTNGIASYPTGTSTSRDDQLSLVGSTQIQADGKLVVVGSTYTTSTYSNYVPDEFAAVRLNTDGSIDTSYGTNGTVDVPVTVKGYTGNTVIGAAIQSDGQIVVSGNVIDAETYILGGVEDFVEGSVIRLTTAGALDTSYGGGSTANGIVLLPDVGNTGNSLTLGVAIDPTDGKAVISGQDGNYSNESLLYRLNTDGSADTSFGTGGMLRPSLTGPVVVQSDGQIVLAGNAVGDDGELIRLNPDGTPDTSFGNPATPGQVTIQPAITSTIALGLDPADGDILVAGTGSVPSASGRKLAVAVFRVLGIANASPIALPPITQPANFDGSGETNAAVFEPTSLPYETTLGTYVIQTVADRAVSSTTLTSEDFGIPGVGQAIPASADYLGNGATQLGDYQPATGTYAYLGNSYQSLQFGTAGAGQSIPVPADYQGVGKADVAVYLTALGEFAIIPSDGSPAYFDQFGSPGQGQSIPAPADYYGTGQDDVAVYLPALAAFAIQDPTGKTTGEVIPFGMPGLGNSIPVPGDYDGSGHTELAVYIPSLGAFFYRPYNGGADVEVPFGTPNSGELPVPGDYTGSGQTEVAVYDPSRGFIAYRPALGGPDVIVYIGAANSGAIPAATPAGALPEFAASGSGSGSGGGNSIRIPGVSGGNSAAITVGKAATATLPGGPAATIASARVALARVNQGLESSSSSPRT